MTQKINTGGPAFPIAVGDHEYVADGMTLRDWFAGQAMAGLMSYMPTATNSTIARQAYGFADSMIAAREESK